MSPVSSNTYSTELVPDPILRRVVIVAGWVASGLGVTIILTLPVHPAWRLFAALVWLLPNARKLYLIAKWNKRCQGLRVAHTGDVEIITDRRSSTSAKLVAGSIVLRRIAWLKLESEDGQRFAELLRGKCSQDEDWRRLQVIWRHLGAGG